MKNLIIPLLISPLLMSLWLGWPGDSFAQQLQNPERQIPAPLKPWEQWATWDERGKNSPPTYNDAQTRLSIWPSRLNFRANDQGAVWEIEVQVFDESWLTLPGGGNTWPQNVKLDGNPAVVIQRNGLPSVKLSPDPTSSSARHKLIGEFSWDRIPQNIALPPEIGLLSLEIDEQPVAIPDWDASGRLWLQRRQTSAGEEDAIALQIFRVFEDGIPAWLRTELHLSVSGQSREEQLGWILPEGWKLATVNGPIPFAVDDSGQAKAQVRAGKWVVKLDAFQTRDTRQIRFAPTASPVASEELVALKSAPEFRLMEFSGIEQVDVTQTMFPQPWRSFPVYRWDTGQPIGIVVKLRGQALEMPEGLRMKRNLWIDEDGQGATYFDELSGRGQKIWRLDAAPQHDLGSVAVNGTDQLITANPLTDRPGVELRERQLRIEAVGRLQSLNSFPATGWQEDAEKINMTFHLPPGWKVFALFGVDSSNGDWLTAWSLLDLFLLLIFSLSVYRLKGPWAGAIAFLAFGLAYHESASPRFTWLFLLVPLALLSVVQRGKIRKWLSAWKYLAIFLLLVNLVPFVGNQIQTAIYPQLERSGMDYGRRSMLGPLELMYESSARAANVAFESSAAADYASLARKQTSLPQPKSTNLNYAPTARIQTGPARPEWEWNQVYCYWDGPVSAAQEVQPILVSRSLNRILTVVRIFLLGALATVLLGNIKLKLPSRKSASTVALLLPCLICPALSAVQAQEIPDEGTLELLRERLTAPLDIFPNAAEIPFVDLRVNGNRISMNAEIHAAAEVAVPLPGKVSAWSPLSVSVDDEPAQYLRRSDGYLWVLLEPGVHNVHVESLLNETAEWQWTFLLQPRRVEITAEDWDVDGLRDGGVPEQQVLFTKLQRDSQDSAAYDRPDYDTIVGVDRFLETGLNWQLRSEVRRLSPSKKAVSIQVPLLPGEKVLSGNAVVNDGSIQVTLSADQETFAWQSEMAISDRLQLKAADTERWIERWHLVISPVWNLTWTGLSPVFESGQEQLVPVWHPWPTEQTTLQFSRPQSVAGPTLTIQRVNHSTELQSRQRSSELTVALKCSLGSDLVISLDEGALISSVTVDEKAIPIQRDDDNLIIPVNPGPQEVRVAWKSETPLQILTRGELIQLPTSVANVTTVMDLPANRWILWTSGPTYGPAVRFWIFLAFALLAALILGSFKLSPLTRLEWILLVIGLTQVHVVAAIIVVAWLFLLAWRGNDQGDSLHPGLFNLRQLLIVLMTIISLCILVVAVGSGLLGNPEMFIIGNGSYRTYLSWFQPQTDGVLPSPTVISVSVWFYRLLMLLWALWLASALLRWLISGWKHFTSGGGWKNFAKKQAAIPSAEPPRQSV